MADKSRERNIAGLYSDYGLDERQKAVSREIGLKSFKLIFTAMVLISLVWFLIEVFFPEAEISFAYTALSYFAAAVACQCYYGIKASKYGVINGITAFNIQTGGLFCAIVMTAGVLWFGFGIKLAGIETESNTALLTVVSAIAAVNHYVMYFCGKRNDKVLEEQAKENEEEEQ